jgi:hypothetical protein
MKYEHMDQTATIQSISLRELLTSLKDLKTIAQMIKIGINESPYTRKRLDHLVNLKKRLDHLVSSYLSVSHECTFLGKYNEWTKQIRFRIVMVDV